MSSRDSLDPLVAILEKFGSEVGAVNKMKTDSVGFKMGAAYASLHKAKQAIHQLIDSRIRQELIDLLQQHGVANDVLRVAVPLEDIVDKRIQELKGDIDEL